MEITLRSDMKSTINRFERRLEISRLTIKWLFGMENTASNEDKEKRMIQFSILELLNHVKVASHSIFNEPYDFQIEDVEEALLYLSKIGALKLEGGFLVLYNAMDIRRIKDSKLRYKLEDYKMLNEFYKQKIQQVHIVGGICQSDGA